MSIQTVAKVSAWSTQAILVYLSADFWTSLYLNDDTSSLPSFVVVFTIMSLPGSNFVVSNT